MHDFTERKRQLAAEVLRRQELKSAAGRAAFRWEEGTTMRRALERAERELERQRRSVAREWLAIRGTFTETPAEAMALTDAL